MRVQRHPPRPGRHLLAAGVSLVLGLPAAQAQIYHLYLLCQGNVAAGLASPSGGSAPATPPPALVASRGAADSRFDEPSEKNLGDGNENVQARTRAFKAAAQRGNAHLDLALRDNNMSMFIQRSNVLPNGERMKYEATQTHYTATYFPAPTSQAWRDWRGSWFFTWYPPFEKMSATRFAVDRQTGRLEGEVVGPQGEVLGLIDMQCEPRRDGQGQQPRF